MAISKKGSRLIHVDGEDFRWKIRHQPTYAQGLEETKLIIALESTSSVGAKLVLISSLTRPDNWLSPHQDFVGPSKVAEAIHSAKTQGWHPSIPGATFQMHLPFTPSI